MTTTSMLSALTGDYVFDAGSTRIGFVARMMVGKVRGQFDQFEGSAHLDGADPAKSSARLAIRPASIQTRNRRRDEHLSGIFLDAGRHPTITFTSTKVEQVGEASFQVTGDLTMRGVTKPITMVLELADVENDPSGSFQVVFQGTATINRQDWGVKWNTVLEGAGALIGDKVLLKFDVAAIRQPSTNG